MRTVTNTTTTVLAALAALMLSGCKMRFSQPQEAAPAPIVAAPVIGLKTILKETNDPLKPYAVQVAVSAKRYDGLVLVKAVEQIPINQKVSLKTVSESPSDDLFANSATYSQLAKISKEEFLYDDTNVNPQEAFWYAVIRPDASGNAGIVEEQGQLPQPQRMSIPAAKVNPTIQLSTSVENNGSGLKPYKVKLSITAPIGAGTDLKLVRASSTSNFNSANYTVLANITQSPFEFEDDALFPTDSAVYGVVNANSSQPYVVPAPASVTLPSLNNSFAALTKTEITTLGGYPATKLSFAPVYGTQYLKKSINGVEVASLQLAQNQTEYLDENLAFDKNYSYQLVQEDHYGNPAGISAAHQVNFPWPVIDFSTEAKAVVNAKTLLHQYEIRVQDLTPTIKRIIQLQISGDGTNFSPEVTWNDETVSRTYTLDFTAPAARYARPVQYDRYNNQLAASPIYTLTIPADLEYSGVNYLNANLSAYGRIKFPNNATLIYGAGSYTISADELIVDGSASIRAYALGSQAAVGNNGGNAGDISLTFKKASGSLTIDSRGQKGGNGLAGSKGQTGLQGNTGPTGADVQLACDTSYDFVGIMPRYVGSASAGATGGRGGTGGQGGPGAAGRQGGASGKITLAISDTNNLFSPTYLAGANLGGSGGVGGLGGDGGPGGLGGIGGLKCLTRQVLLTRGCQTMAGTYTCDVFDQYGSNAFESDYGRTSSGQTGPVGYAGIQGSTGPTGQVGTSNVICTKYPGQTALACN